jgi:hypothetical protein
MQQPSPETATPIDLQEQRERAESLRPLLTRAVGEPEMAAAGTEAIARIMQAAEGEVADVFSRAEEAVTAMAAAAERRVQDQTRERRGELARLRRDLTDSASALAHRFEAMLDLLENAEAELARRAGEPYERRSRPDDRVEAIRLTVRERQRITIPQEAPPQRPSLVSVGEPPAKQAPERRRRRWWRLWTREAA